MRYHHNIKAFLTFLSQNLCLFYPLSFRLLFCQVLILVLLLWNHLHEYSLSPLTVPELLHQEQDSTQEKSCKVWGFFVGWLLECFGFCFACFGGFGAVLGFYYLGGFLVCLLVFILVCLILNHSKWNTNYHFKRNLGSEDPFWKQKYSKVTNILIAHY